ncbi:response regulator [Spirochaeta isovalerica]|uniref:histidine kinase n=1 Tax=Spirochaeta isovalerica TaxID=150 RepID=A0A841RFI5_9SPIO|nr:response regulator [Spirochaeta isovalerica]MBB6482151.1 PAS domain S-box-containing protein [Spirochaeta isovalerica]
MSSFIEILIVEDNQDDLFFIEKALQSSKYRTKVISSGLEAYTYLNEGTGSPDIVLLDYRLPGMDGLEILDALGRKDRDYSFIFLSVDSSIGTVVEAMKRGALDFIVKSETLKKELPSKIDKVYDLHLSRMRKKKMEAELLEAKTAAENNERKYRILVDAVFDAIIVTEEGVIVEANSRAVENSGFSYDYLLGKRALDFIETDDPAIFSEPEDRDWRNVEGRIRCASGEIKMVIINSRTTELKGRNVVISSIHDITESRILEEKLRQSEKMNAIGQLAGGIAHDFNNQLSPIIGYADMLCHQLENPQYRKFANNILHSALRSADLTKKLLSFARKGQVMLESVDINDKLTGLLSEMEREIPSSITIQEKLDPLCNVVKGDPNQLEQAFRNIIKNGIEAMSEGGRLTVETICLEIEKEEDLVLSNHLEPGHYVRIKISDTGWGIPSELKRNIFEPFFTTKDTGQGSGMGLASAYGAVVEHDGYITFASEEGMGTDFVIYLPLDRDSDYFMEIQKNVEDMTARNSTILIVDDEMMLRNMLEDILISDNHSIISCASGEEALETYKENKNRIDLVILDMVMPGLDGFETFTRLKEMNPLVKVLISSGYNMKREIKKLREAGALGFLKKPFKMNELRKQLKNILG